MAREKFSYHTAFEVCTALAYYASSEAYKTARAPVRGAVAKKFFKILNTFSIPFDAVRYSLEDMR